MAQQQRLVPAVMQLRQDRQLRQRGADREPAQAVLPGQRLGRFPVGGAQRQLDLAEVAAPLHRQRLLSTVAVSSRYAGNSP